MPSAAQQLEALRAEAARLEQVVARENEEASKQRAAPPAPPPAEDEEDPDDRVKQYVVIGNFLQRQLNVVRKAFEDLGFRETKRDDPDGWDAAWGTGGALKKKEYGTLAPGQQFNHFPCTHELGNKDRLWKNLDRARSATEGGAEAYDFFPRTFVMPGDAEWLRAEWAANPAHKYILKPKFLARGEGIRLLESPDDLPGADKLGDFVVQRYIDNPLLVQGDKKHTLRLYVGVTSVDPLRVYMLDNGFVHVSSEPYTNDPARLGELRVHVTNPDIQGAAYQSAGGGSNYWNLTRFRTMLREHETLDEREVFERIDDVVVKTLLSVQDVIGECVRTHSRPGASFEVWGLDVLVDDTGKPWIIEVNHTPSTNTDFPAARRIKYSFVRDMLAMVFPSAAEYRHWTEAVYQRLLRIGWDIEAMPDDAIRALVETETEYQISRRGHYRRVYPSARSVARPYPRPEEPTYLDRLVDRWVAAFALDAEVKAKAE